MKFPKKLNWEDVYLPKAAASFWSPFPSNFLHFLFSHLSNFSLLEHFEMLNFFLCSNLNWTNTLLSVWQMKRFFSVHFLGVHLKNINIRLTKYSEIKGEKTIISQSIVKNCKKTANSLRKYYKEYFLSNLKLIIQSGDIIKF